MIGASPRWWFRPATLVVAGVVTALLAVTLLASGGDGRAPLEQARALTEDPGGFDTGLEAAETLAATAQHLNAAIEACRSRTPGGLRCRALSSASGYVQVLASVVLTCTAPGRYEARTRAAAYLARIDALETTADSVPPPPALPRC